VARGRRENLPFDEALSTSSLSQFVHHLCGPGPSRADRQMLLEGNKGGKGKGGEKRGEANVKRDNGKGGLKKEGGQEGWKGR